jgi:signal transduction histidine kinase
MQFTTRTKITALFAFIVSVLIILLNLIIFESANAEWQAKKWEYMHASMESMLTVEEAKKMFVDLEILDASWSTIHRQGLFLKDMEHITLDSLLFDDTMITRANGRAYYWWVETKADGYTYKTIDDVSDIIFARDMTIERSLWLSGIGFILIILIGHFFSGYILRPIQNMNEATRRFSLSEKDTKHHVGIYGNIKDEVVILARSLEELFARVNKEAERLEQFSDDIAHEIKNKLFEIGSSLDIAEKTQNKEYGIQKAKHILKQLSNVVDALLFFARNDVREWEVRNIKSLILETIGTDDKRISIVEKWKVDVVIYPELFMTAVGNIISNAQKFTSETGSIEITVEKKKLTIQDTGIGISKKDIKHIFDRLYKADRARSPGSGHGLWLSITKKIIEELHKMKLSVESTEGKGTTFTIEWI